MTGPAVDPLADYQPGWQSSDPLAGYHPSWRGTAPQPAASAPRQPDTSGDGRLGMFITHLLNIQQGIPGMERVEAGAAALGSHMPWSDHALSYGDALQALRDQTGKIGSKTSMAEHVVGGLLTLPLMPANPVVAGALLGGADQLLGADQESLPERGLRTAAGAGLGALTGKVLDGIVTAARAKIPGLTKTSAANVIDRMGTRKAAAASNYATAIAEGQGTTDTPAVRAVLSRPDIASIVSDLQQTRRFGGVAPHDPQMLDAVYKALSDQKSAVESKLATLTPRDANIGRFKLKDIQGAQAELLNAMTKPSVKPPMMFDVPAGSHQVDPTIIPGHETLTGPIMEGTAGRAMGNQSQIAMDANGRAVSVSPRDVQGPAGPAFMLRGKADVVKPGVSIETPAMRVQTAPAELAPAPMPSYGKAVNDYAQSSRAIDAVQRGSDMIRRANNTLPAGKNLARTTPEAFAEWAKTATPEELQAAHEGILGALKGKSLVRWAKVLGVPVLPVPTRAASQAPGLLRMVDPNAGNLANIGLLSIHHP